MLLFFGTHAEEGFGTVQSSYACNVVAEPYIMVQLRYACGMVKVLS